MKFTKLAIGILLVFSLSSCATTKEKPYEEGKAYTDKELYDLGIEDVKNRKYNKSVKFFSRLAQEYPYSKFAGKSQLMEAYSYYRAEKYEHATAALDEYIKLYPSEESVPYAYYIKALCYYDQILGIRLDQSDTEKADIALTEIVNRFPSSEYAKDSRAKLDLVKDRLAGKEMEIGRFYYIRGDLLAGINRFQGVVNKYENTVHIQEALYRITEGYYQLGVKGEAQRSAAVLGHNYPDSKWYKYSYDLLN